jgi:omega-6 fatty acid desaturase (delta-12 desaturase)
VDQRSHARAKELLVASKEFASENRWLSWWHLWSTLGVIVGCIAIAVSDLPWSLRILPSVVAGLVSVRMFIIYHDYQHNAILGNAPITGWLMAAYGVLTLAPPSVWKHSHDQHHKSNSQTFSENVGSYPIMTTRAYAQALSSKRFLYAVSRHPLTMVLGYFTVFLWRMCLRPFLLNPWRHWDGGFAILVNLAMMTYLMTLGLDVLLLGMIVPLLVASALGAYLFYAQHNFPAAQLKSRSEWNHVEAALHSSSFIAMGPLMNWFTGNIGYHHVHHLNARIPFYRLPEAMAALQELQTPGTTSLKPRDIAACLRLKLWSLEEGRFVGFNGV